MRVPEPFAPLFEAAESTVRQFFDTMDRDPTQGTIHIGGDRYILIRAESMSLRFTEHMMSIMGEEQSLEFLYQFAKIIGQNDAKAFHKKMDLKDPIQKLSAGPVHFSFSGWAMVDISPESNPSPDDNYFLLYDHPNTFESATYEKLGHTVDYTTCVLSAGYSAGWCSESFGLDLDAQEVMCRSHGDRACRFVMAPPEKLADYVEQYRQ